jgi:hypothetical protein
VPQPHAAAISAAALYRCALPGGRAIPNKHLRTISNLPWSLPWCLRRRGTPRAGPAVCAGLRSDSSTRARAALDPRDSCVRAGAGSAPCMGPHRGPASRRGSASRRSPSRQSRSHPPYAPPLPPHRALFAVTPRPEGRAPAAGGGWRRHGGGGPPGAAAAAVGAARPAARWRVGRRTTGPRAHGVMRALGWAAAGAAGLRRVNDSDSEPCRSRSRQCGCHHVRDGLPLTRSQCPTRGQWTRLAIK